MGYKLKSIHIDKKRSLILSSRRNFGYDEQDLINELKYTLKYYKIADKLDKIAIKEKREIEHKIQQLYESYSISLKLKLKLCRIITKIWSQYILKKYENRWYLTFERKIDKNIKTDNFFDRKKLKIGTLKVKRTHFNGYTVFAYPDLKSIKRDVPALYNLIKLVHEKSKEIRVERDILILNYNTHSKSWAYKICKDVGDGKLVLVPSWELMEFLIHRHPENDFLLSQVDAFSSLIKTIKYICVLAKFKKYDIFTAMKLDFLSEPMCTIKSRRVRIVWLYSHKGYFFVDKLFIVMLPRM